jgi:hypothetical protein
MIGGVMELCFNNSREGRELITGIRGTGKQQVMKAPPSLVLE